MRISLLSLAAVLLAGAAGTSEAWSATPAEAMPQAAALLPGSLEGKMCGRLLEKLPEIKKERGRLKPGKSLRSHPEAIRAAKMIIPPDPAQK